MAQTWPGTLPQYFIAGTYTEAPKNQFIRSNVDIGRQRKRRMFTAERKSVVGTMRMTRAQITIFETFYFTTCLGGIDTFNLTDPFDLSVREYEFIDQPSYAHIGGDQYDVNFNLEIIP